MKYIVMRSCARNSEDPHRGPVGRPSRASNELIAEVCALSPRELADIRRDRTVVELSAVMPMSLIRPIETNARHAGVPPKVSWGIKQIGAIECPETGDGITVAVLDRGIDKHHSTFSGLNMETKNFTTDPDDDLDGHGTHCAGTIFGRPVDGHRIGVAPGIKKALIGKVVGKDGASTDALVQALLWAYKNGAHVISMSLGIDYHGRREELKRLTVGWHTLEACSRRPPPWKGGDIDREKPASCPPLAKAVSSGSGCSTADSRSVS